jgi:CRP/FNR family cyclic AMP-dependent transcriptional regulator
METMEPILAAHPFFRGLDSRYLKLILACASRESFTPARFLCRDEEEARKFYVIHHGRVAVEIYRPRRGAVTIQTLGDGEVLGWLWYDQPYHWHLDAKALDLTRVISLDVPCLLDKCNHDPVFGYELMRRYAHHLAGQFRATKVQLADFYGD